MNEREKHVLFATSVWQYEKLHLFKEQEPKEEEKELWYLIVSE